MQGFSLGISGADVLRLQVRLRRLGAKVPVTGIYCRRTMEGTDAFLKAIGLAGVPIDARLQCCLEALARQRGALRLGWCQSGGAQAIRGGWVDAAVLPIRRIQLGRSVTVYRAGAMQRAASEARACGIPVLYALCAAHPDAIHQWLCRKDWQDSDLNWLKQCFFRGECQGAVLDVENAYPEDLPELCNLLCAWREQLSTLCLGKEPFWCYPVISPEMLPFYGGEGPWILAAWDAQPRGKMGPVAPKGWVMDAVDSALARFSRENMLLGVPLYGRDYIFDPSQEMVYEQAVGLQTLQVLRACGVLRLKAGAFTVRSIGPMVAGEWGETREVFRDNQGMEHTLYAETIGCTRKRLALARTLGGAAMWEMGLVTSHILEKL
nr:hypothetical protein [bacterium]